MQTMLLFMCWVCQYSIKFFWADCCITV
jgi:hypothetical protein